jgi:hypothetical protein
VTVEGHHSVQLEQPDVVIEAVREVARSATGH